MAGYPMEADLWTLPLSDERAKDRRHSILLQLHADGSTDVQCIGERLSPRITLQNTGWRKAPEPGLRVGVTLRYLAAGDRYPGLSFCFRVSRHTIAKFLPQVYQAIVDKYKDEVIACPTTPVELKAIADEFERWNVPHTVGAIDGKHIAIRKPPQSGGFYQNHKTFFSIIILALVDADYKFTWVDAGSMGHMSDAQIFNASELKERFEDGKNQSATSGANDKR